MNDATDLDLLRKYAVGNSDAAFEVLISRHVNLVYSAALRKTGNPHAAEEITQAVFIILAQKSARIPDQTILPGWLYQTARFTAASFLKHEARRVRREQEAYMQTEIHVITPDETWQKLAPLLEDAMGQLGDKDRAAIVLRFFSGKSFAEVGTAIGVSENAARKRVNYALGKLHRYFYRHGVSSTTAIIGGAISANSVQAAPVTLAKAIAAISVAKGATATISTLTLIKGALKLMTWQKIKFSIVFCLAALFIAVPLMAHRTRGHNEIAQYEADGELRVQSLGESNEIISEEHETFTVSVKDGKWFIITKPASGINSADVTRYEAGGDGDMFYQVAYFDKKTQPPNTLNSAIGLIENDAVPENTAGNDVSELWLALASSSYLNKSKSGMIEPVGNMIVPFMRNEGWVEKADWTRFQNPPHLPQDLAYFTKKIIGFNRRGRVLITPPPPFQKGFTEAAYNVEEFTNVQGLTLPTKFSFKIFNVNWKVRPTELKTSYNVMGNVTSIRTVCDRTNFVPELTEATFVDDRRFARATKPVEALSYMVTNGVWPATKVQWLQDLYQRELHAR